MLSPEQALDLLADSYALAVWVERRGIPYREAIQEVWKAADAMFDEGELIESPLARRARTAQQRHRTAPRGRTDVEELCEFVERASRLPPRLQEVFAHCIAGGLSHRECAERLSITPDTVRAHLRRLRRLMRQRGGPPEKLPGSRGPEHSSTGVAEPSCP